MGLQNLCSSCGRQRPPFATDHLTVALRQEHVGSAVREHDAVVRWLRIPMDRAHQLALRGNGASPTRGSCSSSVSGWLAWSPVAHTAVLGGAFGSRTTVME
jgi:hypothetical protein